MLRAIKIDMGQSIRKRDLRQLQQTCKTINNYSHKLNLNPHKNNSNSNRMPRARRAIIDRMEEVVEVATRVQEAVRVLVQVSTRRNNSLSSTISQNIE